ncbi:hypothetical protein QJQ45_009789 [Haematococcus lacustris]|nr:hypothetical protein QJQ45_009789 [Haematococcus lacustris]
MLLLRTLMSLQTGSAQPFRQPSSVDAWVAQLRAAHRVEFQDEDEIYARLLLEQPREEEDAGMESVMQTCQANLEFGDIRLLGTRLGRELMKKTAQRLGGSKAPGGAEQMMSKAWHMRARRCKIVVVGGQHSQDVLHMMKDVRRKLEGRSSSPHRGHLVGFMTLGQTALVAQLAAIAVVNQMRAAHNSGLWLALQQFKLSPEDINPTKQVNPQVICSMWRSVNHFPHEGVFTQHLRPTPSRDLEKQAQRIHRLFQRNRPIIRLVVEPTEESCTSLMNVLRTLNHQLRRHSQYVYAIPVPCADKALGRSHADTPVCRLMGEQLGTIALGTAASQEKTASQQQGAASKQKVLGLAFLCIMMDEDEAWLAAFKLKTGIAQARRAAVMLYREMQRDDPEAAQHKLAVANMEVEKEKRDLKDVWQRMFRLGQGPADELGNSQDHGESGPTASPRPRRARRKKMPLDSSDDSCTSSSSSSSWSSWLSRGQAIDGESMAALRAVKAVRAMGERGSPPGLEALAGLLQHRKDLADISGPWPSSRHDPFAFERQLPLLRAQQLPPSLPVEQRVALLLRQQQQQQQLHDVD